MALGLHAGRENGYIGTGRYDGGLYFETNPAVWETLKATFGDQAGDASWLINQRVLEVTAYEKVPEFLNRSLPSEDLDIELANVGDIWDDPSINLTNARYFEIRWLRAEGFEIKPIYDEFGDFREQVLTIATERFGQDAQDLQDCCCLDFLAA